MSEFLEDEQLIAEERERAEALDVLALHQPISELLELQPIVDLPPTASVAEAVSLMDEKRVGCLLILENDRLAGLFTERDVLRKVVAKGVDTKTTHVAELMTRDPDTLPIESPLVFALHRMTVGGYRHVPLLNDDGVPTAIVSMRDIVEYIVALYPSQVLNIPDVPHRSWSRDGG